VTRYPTARRRCGSPLTLECAFGIDQTSDGYRHGFLRDVWLGENVDDARHDAISKAGKRVTAVTAWASGARATG
jgi:hypothetical protein